MMNDLKREQLHEPKGEAGSRKEPAPTRTENRKDQYHIISQIGQGAYGQVYKGRRKQTGQFVAIKAIRKKGKSEKDIKVMRDEIDILKKLRHENIILLLDSFETSSEFVLVTQLGQGELFNIIEDDQYLEEPEIKKIAQQLVRALYYIHSNRITHRDMKPQNILMSSNGIIKLCDFGFARHMSYKTQVLTSLKGTPLYMAPQVVKEEPYNHTADLWSLGVILYELSTGSPPFTASNLINLVEHISKDSVAYPDTIVGDFKSLLKGLLNKDPKKRLGWPDLLEHPFIRESEEQKIERLRLADQFNGWVGERQNGRDQQVSSAQKIKSDTNKEKSMRNISPIKGGGGDENPLNTYTALVGDKKACNSLRTDQRFLERILNILSLKMNEIVSSKDKMNQLQTAVKLLAQVLVNSDSSPSQHNDIARNLSLPGYLLETLKGFVRIDARDNYIEVIGNITKLIGLLGKFSFTKQVGIEMVYLRYFLPLLNQLTRLALSATENHYQTFLINLLRTVGIFAHNASTNHLRSFSFYKDILELHVIPEFAALVRVYHSDLTVLKMLAQVLSVFMHPVYGDIELFPWSKHKPSDLSEHKDIAQMSECLREEVIRSFLEKGWVEMFEQILGLQNDPKLLIPKISVMRIIIHALRLSQEFADTLLVSKSLVKLLVNNLSICNDTSVFGTLSTIISQMLRYAKEAKKSSILQEYLPMISAEIIKQLTSVSSTQNSWVLLFGCYSVFQELMSTDEANRVVSFVSQPRQLELIAQYLSEPTLNKLEEMRKIEGSNYGVHLQGLYDPLLLLLHRLMIRTLKQGSKPMAELASSLSAAHIDTKLIQLIIALNPKTDLSPKGLVSALMLTYDFISGGINREFGNPAFLKVLVGLLRENQIKSLLEWPENSGGGKNCVIIVYGNFIKLFLTYLGEQAQVPNLLTILAQAKLVENLVQLTVHLDFEGIASMVTLLVQLFNYDEKSEPLVRQFVDGGGLGLFIKFSLLKPSNDGTLLDACNLLALVARASKDFYESIDCLNCFPDLVQLMSHGDPQIRAKGLNILGNMCRHSNYFYNKIKESGILSFCINACRDNQRNVRKLACLMIGNASFHSDLLYDQLRQCLPMLVSMIRDNDQKIRSFAAAAIGNLGRNSDLLDKDIAITGVIPHLMGMLANEKLAANKKVALLTISNFLGLSECRTVLVANNIVGLLHKFMPPNYSADQSIVKIVQKTLEKLA